MTLSHGDAVVVGRAFRTSKQEGVTTRTSEVHVAVSLDYERLTQIQHETGTVEGKCTAVK